MVIFYKFYVVPIVFIFHLFILLLVLISSVFFIARDINTLKSQADSRTVILEQQQERTLRAETALQSVRSFSSLSNPFHYPSYYVYISLIQSVYE